jgi:hypothetical protein
MSEGKPSTGLVIGLIIGVVVLCGGGFAVLGALFFFRAARTTSTLVGPGGQVSIDVDGATVTYPFSAVLGQFRKAIEDGDADTAYALLSDAYKGDVSLADFRKDAEAPNRRASADDPSETGEYKLVDGAAGGDTGSWKHSIWTDDGMATERIDFIEQSPGVWRVERWVVE